MKACFCLFFSLVGLHRNWNYEKSETGDRTTNWNDKGNNNKTMISATTSPAPQAAAAANNLSDEAGNDDGEDKESISITNEENETTAQSSASIVEDHDSIEAITASLGAFSIAPQKTSIREHISAPSSIKKVAKLLASNKYKKVVVLTGAGVSCNAGIPDFRSPGTGLYDNLQKYNLPYPEAVFDLGFYRRNPDPFVQLASELWPGLKHSPTITHSFIALLEQKGILLRNYTQNIDMLDVLAGVSEERMIECHGHFRTASCTMCSRSFDGEDCKRIIVEEKRAPSCMHCKGHIKPDIGEFLLNSCFEIMFVCFSLQYDSVFCINNSLLSLPLSLSLCLSLPLSFLHCEH